MKYLESQLNAALHIAEYIQQQHPLVSQFDQAKAKLIEAVADRATMATFKSPTLDLPPSEATKMLLTWAIRNRRKQ